MLVKFKIFAKERDKHLFTDALLLIDSVYYIDCLFVMVFKFVGENLVYGEFLFSRCILKLEYWFL
jgi:hypothetical protein